MNSIMTTFLILVGLPLLAFVLSVVWVVTARRNRDLARDEWTAGTVDLQAENARLLIVLAYCATKVIYGVVQAFFLAVSSGSLSGIPTPLDPAISLPAYCAVFGAVNAVTTLAEGFVGAGAVRKEALTDTAGFRGTIIKLCLVEFLAVLGLLASTLIIIL